MSANKKVLVSRFDRAPLQGFVRSPDGFEADGFDLLTPEGSHLRVPYAETRAVCFVREFETGETWRENRVFATRPKSAGLWVRLSFVDGDSLEGIAANNLMLVEGPGFSVVPPDPTYQNQRIFVPRSALREVQVLGVIGSPLRRRKPKPADVEKQLRMFE
jgi:hypothetical protein